MKPIKIKFNTRRDGILQEMEGHLVGFGMDCGQEGESWSTGIIILPDGKFLNIAVERLTLKEPFKEEDWS